MAAAMSDVLDFFTDTDGKLECLRCDEQLYCIHRQGGVLLELDGADLWTKLEVILEDTDSTLIPMVLDVPIQPKELRSILWERVSLERANIPKCVKVFEIGVEDIRHEFVGFLHPDEGRLTILSMLDQWLFADPVTLEKDCGNKAHTFTSQLIFEKNYQTTRGRRLEAWSRKLYGMCLGCKQVEGKEDFSDLVPDIGARPRNPFGKYS